MGTGKVGQLVECVPRTHKALASSPSITQTGYLLLSMLVTAVLRRQSWEEGQKLKTMRSNIASLRTVWVIKSSSKTKKLGVVIHIFNPSALRQRQMDRCELEASLVYLLSSRTAET